MIQELTNLLLAQAGKAEIYTPAYARARVYFYACLVVIRGIGEIAAGGIVHATLTTGRCGIARLRLEQNAVLLDGPSSLVLQAT